MSDQRDGDVTFSGVDCRRPPERIEAGRVAFAKNARFTDGKITPRRGTKIMPWTAGSTYSAGVRTLGRHNHLWGAGAFRDPVSGVEVILYAADGKVYAGHVNSVATEVSLPDALEYYNLVDGQAFAVGDTISGVTSSATATIKAVDSATGTLFLSARTGTFLYNEALQVNSVTVASVLYPACWIGERVRFVQCFDVVVMFRGPNKPVLKLADWSIGFEPVAMTANDITGEGTENPTDGTIPISNADRGVMFANRLLVPKNDDSVDVSDYLNYTRYQPTFSTFRINQGTEDRLVTVIPLDRNTLAALKENSVYIIRNVYGDLSETTLDELTRDYGCIAGDTACRVGNDVWFLSRRGVTSVQVTTDGAIKGLDLPVSESIQSIIDRIDWEHASEAVAAFFNNRFYLAVPLTGEDWTTAVRKDRHLSGAWELDGSNRLKILSTFAMAVGTEVDIIGVTTTTNKVVHPSSPRTRVYSCTAFSIYYWIVFEATGSQVGATNGLSIEYEIIRPLPTIPAGLEAYVTLTGKNNVVLVYDTVAPGWCGLDVLEMGVIDFFTAEYCGARRLFAATHQGVLMLYDDLEYSDLVDEVVYTGNADNTGQPTQNAIELYVESRGYTLGSEVIKNFLQVDVSLGTLQPNCSINAAVDGVEEEVAVVTNLTKDPTVYFKPFDAAPWANNNVNNDQMTLGREDYSVMENYSNANANFWMNSGIELERVQQFSLSQMMRTRGRWCQLKLTNRNGKVEINNMGVRGVPEETNKEDA